MIKVKISDIVNETENLKTLQTMKLPIKVSYRIMRLINKLQSELTIYDTKRNELIKEFGEVNEEGNYSVKDPEKIKEFTEKIKEVLEVEIEIDFEPIDVEMLGDLQVEPRLLTPFIFA